MELRRDQVQTFLKALEAHVARAPDRAFAVSCTGHATLVFEDQRWCAGQFLTPSIGELRQELAKLPAAGSGEVRLFRLAGPPQVKDIGRLQAHARPKSLFQAASQLNCLEAPSAAVTSVASYLHDPTQGPRASISAFPGTFLRHYRARRNDGRTFVQTTEDSLDLLADVAPDGESGVRAGYLLAHEVRDPAALAAALTQDFNRIRVGVHANVEVVLGANWIGPVLPGRRIDQVFTSTIALGGYSRPRGEDAAFAQIRQQLLRAAYLGTLLAALDLGDERAVLTLIGGGVFGNPIFDIVAAIEWAVEAARAVASRPLDVVVNDFGGVPELRHLEELAASAVADLGDA